jgi:predicted nucleotidyltransferase
MTDDLSERIQRAAEVLKSFGAREVYVFGSAATGEMDEHSDIDLAVSGLPPEVFFRAYARASECLPARETDLVDLDSDTPFTRYLREEGELQRVG